MPQGSIGFQPVFARIEATPSRQLRYPRVEKSQDDAGSGPGEFLADGPGEAEELGDGAGDGVGVAAAVPREAALSRGEGDGLARTSSHAQSSPVYPPISFSRTAQRS